MPAPLLGSQELGAVLAAVAVGAGLDTSGNCSTFVSVSSSFEGVSEGSSNVVISMGGVSVGSTGADSGMGASASAIAGSAVGSDGMLDSAGL